MTVPHAPPAGVGWLVNGAGLPVTVFLPGLGGAIGQLRPLGGGVPGTRVFCELADDPSGQGPADFAALATAFRTVADRCAADRALGVSLGAGVLLRLLSQTPDRFARVVLFQPSTFDVVPDSRRKQTAEILRLAAAGDLDLLTELLAAELPADVRDSRPARAAARLRAERLSRPEGLRLLNNLASGEPPATDQEALSAVTVPVLVVAAEGDPVHPVAVAAEIAAAFPYGQLEVFSRPPLWHARAELRALVGGFLGG